MSGESSPVQLVGNRHPAAGARRGGDVLSGAPVRRTAECTALAARGPSRLHDVLRSASVRRAATAGFRPACVVWAGLILYATLAMNQHYVVDIIAGTSLTIVA